MLLPNGWGCIAFFVCCFGKYQFYLFTPLVIKFILGMHWSKVLARIGFAQLTRFLMYRFDLNDNAPFKNLK